MSLEKPRRCAMAVLPETVSVTIPARLDLEASGLDILNLIFGGLAGR